VTVTEPLSAGPRLGDDRALRTGMRMVLALLCLCRLCLFGPCLSEPASAAGPQGRTWVLAAGTEAATSDSARVAPGPSERTAPAAPEIRQAPPGGGNDPKPDETTLDGTRRDETGRDETGRDNARPGRARGGKSHD
jgi:hypothetical protein